jgi:hypothetical protein
MGETLSREPAMRRDDPDGDLWQRIRLLEERNRHLHYQNGLLQDAIETICFAFLNNSKNLDTAIQTAVALQQKAREPPPPDTKIRSR